RLASIVLRDSAYLAEEEARRSAESGLSRHDPPLPLYVSADAERAIRLFTPLPMREQRTLAPGISVSLHRAGHILGSRFVVLTVGDVRIVFSGDLGRTDHPLLLPPEPPGDADYFVVESTYGNREHPVGAIDALADVLTRTLERGGVALLPAFAVDRTPMLLHELRGLVLAGRVPDVPVYADSPMALRALTVYREALARGGDEFRPSVTGSADPFDPGHLELVPDESASSRLNDPKKPCIVISASGMATGGRVLHHLRGQLPRARNSVVLTGYQVPGTRGHDLVQGAPQVKIHGRYVPVRAEIANVRGFSAHADAPQLLSWLRHSVEPRTVFVVHGEPASSEALATTVRAGLDWTAVVPRLHERVLVD
uniref:MBL fold metallo-hydrolase RNA specificity domain-containing protein n=1 Tax=Nocardioides sp. TaxID=35761 RepID=UPI0035645C68